jgi:hypothetical protein
MPGEIVTGRPTRESTTAVWDATEDPGGMT